MRTKERILLESKAWREEKLTLDVEYFKRLNAAHDPKILWISSTDSLAAVREITNTEPGDIIIYGNLANQVRDDDESLMAVVEEAVTVYNVSQIILCGFSHCSGIRHIVEQRKDLPNGEQWLSKLRALYEAHYEDLKSLSPDRQEKLLSELNIRQQVINLSRIPCIQKSWERRDFPEIYGWYFDLATGTLQEVFSLEKNHRLKQVSTITQDGAAIKIPAS